MKKTLAQLLCAALTLTLFAGCGAKAPVTTGEIGVVRDEEFGNIYLDLTIDAFNDLGFAFGDSVDRPAGRRSARGYPVLLRLLRAGRFAPALRLPGLSAPGDRL